MQKTKAKGVQNDEPGIARLVYAYLIDGFNQLSFYRKDLNFGGPLIFHVTEENENNFRLSATPNREYVTDLYENDISVSCIVGKNGSGKTTLLKMLNHIVNDVQIRKNHHSTIFGYISYISVFELNGRFYHQIQLFDGFDVKLDKALDLLPIGKLAVESLGIHYAGYFDWSAGFDFSDPGFIDVSTDHLIHRLFEDKEEESSLKQVEYFKRADLKMQLGVLKELDARPEHLDYLIEFIRPFIPKGGKVAIAAHLGKYNKYSFQYVGSQSISAYKRLFTEYRKLEADYVLTLRQKANVLFGNPSAELFRLRLYMRLVDDFFMNAEFRGNENIDSKNYRLEFVDLSEDDNLEGLALFSTFFLRQKLIDGDKHAVFLKVLSDIEDFATDLTWEINTDFFDTQLEKMLYFVHFESQLLSLFPFHRTRSLFDFDWRGLSAGEKAMLTLFGRLNQAAEIREKHFVQKNNLVFFLDEPEIAFHPQWQQEYLFYLLKFINWRFADQACQIILTSHSPFILTDIPDYAVIKLGHELHAQYERKTFGSNIYDLLADSFFLPGGFMGKIASETILKLTDFVLGKNTDYAPENAEKIIRLIGEPLIRERLLELFNERFRQEPTKAQLLRKITELENKLRREDEK